MDAFFEDQQSHKTAIAAAEDIYNARLIQLEEVDRPAALFEIQHTLDDVVYWKLVRLAWTQGDENWRNLDNWRKLLTAERPFRNQMMVLNEQKAFLGLADPVKIYRGHIEFNRDGWSWTLHDHKAEEFSRNSYCWYGIGTPKVTFAKVRRSRIIAYFNLLDEQEILIDPNDAYDHETRDIHA